MSGLAKTVIDVHAPKICSMALASHHSEGSWQGLPVDETPGWVSCRRTWVGVLAWFPTVFLESSPGKDCCFVQAVIQCLRFAHVAQNGCHVFQSRDMVASFAAAVQLLQNNCRRDADEDGGCHLSGEEQGSLFSRFGGRKLF
jgi:hypothetical protein